MIHTSLTPHAYAQWRRANIAYDESQKNLIKTHTQRFSSGTITGHHLLPNQAVQIILLEDLHRDYATQRQLISILKSLRKTFGIKKIAHEGAISKCDTQWFAALPDIDSTKETAQQWLRQGLLTAAEYLAITGEPGWNIYGVEDSAYYHRHLNIAQQILSHPRKPSRDEDSLTPLLTLKATAERLQEHFVDLRLTPRMLAFWKHLQTAIKLFQTTYPLNYVFDNPAILQETTQSRDISKLALEFYALAQKRERILLERTVNLAKDSATPVALIAGGFHAESLDRGLRKRNISFIRIAPNILFTQSSAHSYRHQLAAGITHSPQLHAVPLRSWLQPPLITDTANPAVLDKFRQAFLMAKERTAVLLEPIAAKESMLGNVMRLLTATLPGRLCIMLTIAVTLNAFGIPTIASLPALAMSSFVPIGENSYPKLPRKAHVIEVPSGYELIISSGHRVRLIGIDVPKPTIHQFGETLAGEPLGDAAREALEDLVFDKQVTLSYDVFPHDPKGRLLAYVIVVDGNGEAITLNEWIIANGFGHARPVMPNIKMAKQLHVAELNAQANEVGLWQIQGTTRNRIKRFFVDPLPLYGRVADSAEGVVFLEADKKIRLAGIEFFSPQEIEAVDIDVSVYWDHVREIIAKLTANKTCRLEYENSQPDATGAYTSYIYLTRSNGDRLMLNNQLVAFGLAKASPVRNGNPYQKHLAATENEARELGVGIWSGRLRKRLMTAPTRLSRLGLTQTGRVLRCYDGDTILVQMDNRRRFKIRLTNMDAPEMHYRHKGRWVKDPEPYAVQATNALWELVVGHEIFLEYGKKIFGPYGRILADIYVQNDPQDPDNMLHVNAEMVRLGLAKSMPIWPNTEHHRTLAQAQSEAIENERGIWNPNQPFAEWEKLSTHPDSEGNLPDFERLPTSRVIRVVDGDTVIIFDRSTHRLRTLRLAGIDAPNHIEASNQSRLWVNELEPYAELATDALWWWVSGQTVWIEMIDHHRDPKQRLLGHLWVETKDGRKVLVNEALIEMGLATARQVADIRRYAHRLHAAELTARRHRTGMWSGKENGGAPESLLPIINGHPILDDNFVATAVSQMQSAPKPPQYSRVHRVLSGHKIILDHPDPMNPKHRMRVRIAGIRAPQIRQRTGNEWYWEPEPFGEEAWEAAKRWLTSQTIRLEYERFAYDPKYKHWYAHIFVPIPGESQDEEEETLLSVELARDGLVAAKNYGANNRYREEIEAAQAAAKSEAVGKWHQPTSTLPLAGD